LQFLNPLALIGLAAALLPLAVHLLHRSRPRDVPFSHLAFLRQLHASRMRSLRLRQWLVLLLRMLALACLALAFARPALQEGSGLFGRARPTTAVIVIDQSYSTRFTPPAGRWFDRLQRRADEVLSLFDGPRDEVYILPWPDGSAGVAQPLTAEAARQRLAALSPGAAATDPAGALRQAESLLRAHADRQRELYLFTDGARPGWDEASRTLTEVPLFLLTATEAGPRNRYVGPVESSDWLAAPGEPLALRTRIGLWGGDAEEVAADLFIDGERVQRRRVSLVPGSETAVEFSVAPRRSGRLTGFVQIDDDDLPADNRRYFTLHVPERIRVAVAAPTVQQAYYARRALQAAASGDAALEISLLSLDELSAQTLAGQDVLFLVHVERPARPVSQAVRGFAAAGGGVLIVPGPEADAVRINRDLLDGLVPASLVDIAGQPGESGATRLDSAAGEAALFAGLLATAQDRPRVTAAWELSPERQLSVLARFDDGLPALVEGRGPGGHALLWPVPFDLAWSDLPLRGLFTPWMQRLARYLGTTSADASYIVGQRAWRRLETTLETRVEAEAPSGRRRVVQPESLGDERLWRVPALDEAGHWRLLAGGSVVDEFAVNVDVGEADLTPLSIDDLRRRLGEGVHLLPEGEETAAAVTAARFGRELWRELLALALLLLLVEVWIARAPDAARREAA
jgi:hypothetical protein